MHAKVHKQCNWNVTTENFYLKKSKFTHAFSGYMAYVYSSVVPCEAALKPRAALSSDQSAPRPLRVQTKRL